MRHMHGVEGHGRPYGPDQRHDPAPAAVILGTFPHGTLDCEGNEQAKDLQSPEDWMEDLLHCLGVRLGESAWLRTDVVASDKNDVGRDLELWP